MVAIFFIKIFPYGLLAQSLLIFSQFLAMNIIADFLIFLFINLFPLAILHEIIFGVHRKISEFPHFRLKFAKICEQIPNHCGTEFKSLYL